MDLGQGEKIDAPGFLLYAQAPEFIEQSKPAIEKATQHAEKIIAAKFLSRLIKHLLEKTVWHWHGMSMLHWSKTKHGCRH